MSSPRPVPSARPQTYKSQPTYASRPDYRAPSTTQRSAPVQRSITSPSRSSTFASRESLSRTPLTRVPSDSASRFTPRKSGPGDTTSRTFGDRRWSGGDRYDGDRYSSRYDRGGWYGDRYGSRYGYGYRHGYHRYPHYHDRYHRHYGGYGYYGWYSPYYRPAYVYAYPYFVPTFSFGLSFWDTPDYYAAYYSEPAVVYTQPTTIVESPTYYSAPAPYYADSGTTYVQSETYAAPVETGTTYVERRVETQYGTAGTSTVTTAPPTIGMPPTAPPASAPPGSQQPAPQGEAPVKQPDQRVLAAVGRGNEHFGAGRYAEARAAYGEAMGIDDTDGVAMLLFGLASFGEGDFATAGTVTLRALDATPDLIYYPFNVKALYRSPEKFQEHVNALARRVDADPGDDQARFLLGYMWYASGDAQNAKVVFESLATNRPSEELYPALRDAAAQAIEMMAKQPQGAPAQSAP